MSKKNNHPIKPNHKNKTELFTPVELKLANQILAVATVKKKPSTRTPLPYWKMEIKTNNKGERIFISLGRYSREQLPDVMLKTYQEHYAIGSQASPQKQTVSKASYPLTLLLDEWFRKYVLIRSPNSGVRKEFQFSIHTVKGYNTCIKQLKRHGGKLNLSSYGIGDIEDLRHSLQMKYAPRTVHLTLNVFKQVLEWGIKRNKPIKLVTFNNKRPPRSQHVSNDKTPTQKEVTAIYNDLRFTPLKIIFLLAWKTGCRIGEIVDLTWERIEREPDGALLNVVGKTGERIIPIDKETTDTLYTFFKTEHKNGRLFAEHYRRTATLSLARTCERLGIEVFTMHGLRRLRSDTLFRSNIEPAVYEALMGHSVKIALEAYRRPNLEDLKKASGTLNTQQKEAFELEKLLQLAKTQGIDIKQLLASLLLK